MKAIRQKNTRPEMLVRQLLHARGFRFRLHSKLLPGTPDIILPKYKVAIFVHGCFWHGHNCPLFKIPQTRTEFWLSKIRQNQVRDEQTIGKLNEAGWRTLIIWECAVKARRKHEHASSDILVDTVSTWLTSLEMNGQINSEKILPLE